jgi:hypothetical protein
MEGEGEESLAQAEAMELRRGRSQMEFGNDGMGAARAPLKPDGEGPPSLPRERVGVDRRSNAYGGEGQTQSPVFWSRAVGWPGGWAMRPPSSVWSQPTE